MNSITEIVEKNLTRAIGFLQLLSQDTAFVEKLAQSVDWMVSGLKQGGRIYTAGNGGSAADAQHIAAELVGKLDKPRRAFAAEALSVDTSALTAIGNDFGFERIFSRQLEAKATPKDIFLALTTSGNSSNILHALEICRTIPCRSILLSGRDGGKAIRLADLTLLVPGQTSGEIQQCHQVIYHSICEAIEKGFEV